MILSAVFFFFIVMLLMPFLPGVVELVKQEDADPLYIPMDYMRNPRYFGRAFKKILFRAVGGLSQRIGSYNVVMSKKEKVELCQSLDAADGAAFNILLFIKGNLSTGSHVLFEKELYVTGDVTAGSQNIFQSLNSEGKAVIGAGSIFRRWLDAEGDVTIAENCDLGISVSSGGRIFLGADCVFRRLYAMPIVTGGIEADFDTHGEFPSAGCLPEPGSTFVRRNERTIPPGALLEGNIVFTRDVTIGVGSNIRGSVKSYGRLVLEDNVVVEGNLFSDDDIMIGRNGKIGGHIFSQKAVHICENAVIGCPEKIKSIIGKKSIRIEKNVVVYGFVSTEGNGTVL